MTPRPSLGEATAALTAPGQLFEMEDIEVRGVAMRAWKSAPDSLRTVLDMSLSYGDADYLVYGDERTTYAEHYRAAATLAHRLRDTLGVREGERVAIAMRNLPEWVIAFWAAAVAGAVVVPLNAWWTGEELAYGLADSDAAVCLCDTERAERLRPHRAALGGLRTVVVTDEHRREVPPELTPGDHAFATLLGEVDPGAVPPDVAIDPDSDATIFYTSGTTGRPKGAVGTHRNACTNLMTLAFLHTVSQYRGGAGLGDVGGSEQRCYLLNVPLFHVTGCYAVVVTNTAAGTKLVLMHHFDPAAALELIERERVTVFGGVPTLVMRVLDCPDLARRDVSSVRSVAYGGAPAPADLVRRIGRAFKVGQPSNGYGLTETSAVTAFNVGEDYIARPDSVGHAVPVADVVVVAQGFAGAEPEPLPPGAVGELWVKGPHVVRGYWNRPEETARTFAGGWLRTGDIARIDAEGFITIVDRAKDVVIRGGENVYSAEVEDALFSHPAVADCAVLGVPDPVLGEEVGAVVVLRPAHKVAADEFARHLRRHLAGYMVPTRWWFRQRPLPRNPAGKVLKRALRAEVLGETDDTVWEEAGSAWDETAPSTGAVEEAAAAPADG